MTTRLSREGVDTTKDVRLYKVGDIIPLSHCCYHDRPVKVTAVMFNWNGGTSVDVIYICQKCAVCYCVTGEIDEVCITAKQRRDAYQEIADAKEHNQRIRQRILRQIADLQSSL